MINANNSSDGRKRLPTWQRLMSWASKHPFLTIFGMALFASILSTHPVVFFGKSFVSPNHNTPLLYERYPTLPGYSSKVVENVKGADVGAVMWAHLPYSIIQSRAIFEDGELPLWNRFNSTGVPLLGQGQSMLGDPLHVVVVLAKGASWAWDLKYVTAKTLFALGLGLIAHVLTRHLAISLLLAFSSIYIGFFTFRFNHPAIFSMAYAPWILYFWIRFVQVPAPKIPSAVFWLGALILANWTVMNSGTAKEAYMLLVLLNVTGFLLFLFNKEDTQTKLAKATRLGLAQIIFVLISAPVWFTFLDTIGKSHSSYQNPAALQIPTTHFIGIFDDIFYQQLVRGELVVLPAANFMILIGFTWAIVRWKYLIRTPAFLAVSLGAAIPFSLAFGVIPADVITQVPFLGNVVHVGNTFSVVLIIHLIVLAAFGMHACCDRSLDSNWRADMVRTIAALAVLLLLYFGTAPTEKTHFFYVYVSSLALAFAAFPILIKRLTEQRAGAAVLLLLLVCVAGLHWRHGMYLKTGADDYVMNPQVRADLRPESRAIQFTRQHSAEPYRSLGLGNNLFPGYNAALGVESINGPDALLSRHYRSFMKALPIGWGWDWRVVVSKDRAEALRPALDLLNVKYYFSFPDGPPVTFPHLKHMGRFDLDVYESDTVWPRAFFTNRVYAYRAHPDFFNMIFEGDGTPFAAVQDNELSGQTILKALVALRGSEVVPATNYKLTNNTTAFTITAPDKGVITLTEAYSKDDFEVTLNGKPANHIRVNHAFRGIVIDAPGTYSVVFTYWPRYFSLLLLISAVSLITLVVWLANAGYRYRAKRPYFLLPMERS